MSAFDEMSLVNLGLLGIATIDENYRVLHSQGELSRWLVVGEIATEKAPALIGMEQELKALRQTPRSRLDLPNISFGEELQQNFYTINVQWDQKTSQYAVLTTAIGAHENYLVNATQLARAAHFFDEQLSTEREHFRRIYESSPQLAVCFREDAKVLAVSELLQSEYLEGDELVHDGSKLPLGHVLRVLKEDSAWSEVWAGREIKGVPLLVQNKKGEWRDLEVSGLKAEHLTQRWIEAYFSFVDVTERNSTLAMLQVRNEELEVLSNCLKESNCRFEQFATVAAHDLLSPLRRITRLSKIIEDEFEGSASTLLHSSLEKLKKSAFQGRALVHDVMELSRVTAMSSQCKALLPSDVMRIVEDEFRFDLDEVGGEISYSGPGVVVDADEALLLQIYRNLVSNAIKYRAPHRALRIQHKVICNEKGLCLEVSDNGRGFDGQKHDVFGAFVRLVGSREIPGTGVGLSIVKEAANTLGWRISVRAEEGEGAAFILCCGKRNAEFQEL